MQLFLSNLYSIYFTLYSLWWVSVFIIIYDEGFHPRQDIPWFILFTSILFLLWALKSRFSLDNSFIFHETMSAINRVIHLTVIIVGALFMIFF